MNVLFILSKSLFFLTLMGEPWTDESSSYAMTRVMERVGETAVPFNYKYLMICK